MDQSNGTCRDHNATSYSTETGEESYVGRRKLVAEIITLRAIALKLTCDDGFYIKRFGRDHNATSYSTETSRCIIDPESPATCRDHNATSYSTETYQNDTNRTEPPKQRS